MENYVPLLIPIFGIVFSFVTPIAITPDILTACIMLGLAFIALIRFAARFVYLQSKSCK